MPYIRQEERNRFTMPLNDIAMAGIATEGELNFLITTLCQIYLTDKNFCYKNLNAVIGCLESAKLEFYRQIVSPYEDKKIIQNGSIEIPTAPGC